MHWPKIQLKPFPIVLGWQFAVEFLKLKDLSLPKMEHFVIFKLPI